MAVLLTQKVADYYEVHEVGTSRWWVARSIPDGWTVVNGWGRELKPQSPAWWKAVRAVRTYIAESEAVTICRS